MTEELARFVIRRARDVGTLLAVNVAQVAKTIQPEWMGFQ